LKIQITLISLYAADLGKGGNILMESKLLESGSGLMGFLWIHPLSHPHPLPNLNSNVSSSNSHLCLIQRLTLIFTTERILPLSPGGGEARDCSSCWAARRWQWQSTDCIITLNI